MFCTVFPSMVRVHQCVGICGEALVYQVAAECRLPLGVVRGVGVVSGTLLFCVEY